MADNLRWWKLWTTAPSDDALLALPPAIRWAWAALGAHTRAHGDSGMLITSPKNAVLAAEMGVAPDDLERTLRMLPNITVEESQKRPGYLAVTWANWVKYQEDSTQAERRKASRLKRRGEEIRRDERRGEAPKPPQPPPERGSENQVQRPPSPPVYVLSCGTCAAMLQAVNEGTARLYTAPGRTGEWMHMAHAGRAEADVLAVIRRQVELLTREPGKTDYLAPSCLFKPENWDRTVNAAKQKRVLTSAEILGER